METFTDMIDHAQREIRRDEEDLERLKSRYPDFDFVRVQPPAQHPILSARNPRATLSELEAAVLAKVESSPHLMWTSRNIVTELTTDEFALPEKDESAMNAVGYALTNLRDAGRIRRSYEGRGRDPHRYIALTREREVPEEASLTTSIMAGEPKP